MEEYKKNFINFMVDSHVLKFGEFTLKSGRKSPFFMNAGAYKTGSQLIKLGEYYARAINDKYGLDFDVLFGPSYKGIPLAVATVMAISKLYGRDIKYCANRKEIKDHGDKGALLGTHLRDEDRGTCRSAQPLGVHAQRKASGSKRLRSDLFNGGDKTCPYRGTSAYRGDKFRISEETVHRH